MVFFNYATMQMAAKIVYYGPGLCGKTTNLHYIYAKTSPQSRGEMVSLETETDRTLFFDLLPIDVGVIGGFKTRLQLYTIPGQVFYNTTRKLVLKGVDGLVFVADSQIAMFDANLDSFRNLRENLNEIGLNLDEIPMVLQINKRDLPNVTSIDSLLDALDEERRYEYVEAIAAKGDGVFETLKLISKLTLRTLRRRMTGDEPVKAPQRKPGLADVAQFRIKNEAPSEPWAPESPHQPAIGAPAPPPPAFASGGTTPTAAAAAPAPHSTFTALEEMAEEIRGEVGAEGAQAPEPEPEIEFRQTSKPARKPDVKTVKVRSSIDVMAELEALRKKATQGTPKGKKEGPAAPARPARELHKALNLTVPRDVLTGAHSMRVTVSFEDAQEGVLQQQTEKVELGDSSDLGSVALNLRIDQG
jgi:signal recognition particle receptor subunit beta